MVCLLRAGVFGLKEKQHDDCSIRFVITTWGKKCSHVIPSLTSYSFPPFREIG